MTYRKFVAIFAIAVLLPSLSNAALTFDMHDVKPFGYGTEAVLNSSFQPVPTTAENDGGGSGAVVTIGAAGASGVLDWNYTGVNGASNSQSYVDLQVINNDSLGLAINGFDIDYDLVSSGFAFVSVIWNPVGGTLGTGAVPADDVTVTPGPLTTGPGQSFHFQGEDVYALSDAATGSPLVPFGPAPGTIRFLFSSFSGAAASATLSNISITAIVPEPSSALLLSGVLGLFGTCFRRRRKLTA